MPGKFDPEETIKGFILWSSLTAFAAATGGYLGTKHADNLIQEIKVEQKSASTLEATPPPPAS